MLRIKGLLNASVNLVTRKNARHNRALRELLYLLKSIEDLVAKYRLQKDGPSFNTVFKNIGQLRLDTTEIAYRTEITITRVRDIEGKDLQPLLNELFNSLDEFKRALFTRTLSTRVLAQNVSKLDMILENLLAEISDIKYK